MTKFNTKTNTRNVKPTSAVKTVSAVPDTKTHEGAPGFTRDAKSELFLLGVANMVSEDTFYEKGVARDKRFEELVAEVAATDPGWLFGFLPWLRREANMRSAPVVGAAIAVKTLKDLGTPGSRKLIASVMGRADEPGEFLAYWISRWGDKLPQPVKRGVADAALRLYNQRSLLKYDTVGKGLRFSNVIQLTHPQPKTAEQRELFKFAMDRVYKDAVEMPELLRTAAKENKFRKAIAEPDFSWQDFLLRPDRSDVIREAGLTWEDLIPRVPAHLKVQAWEALIPTMGYMALLRNLRNFDEAGISMRAKALVSGRLADPEQVAKSKQFPYRFLSAYKALSSLTWGPALETALDLSLANVPEFPGRTLVMVDRSGSMFPGWSGANREGISRAEQAAIFGVAVALRNLGRVDLVEFGSSARRVTVKRGDSLLKTVNTAFHDLGGTDPRTGLALFDSHDRVIIITDEQFHFGYAGMVPASTPIYTFNLGGYKPGGSPSGAANRHTFGGLTDAAFKVIPLLEVAASQKWPWED